MIRFFLFVLGLAGGFLQTGKFFEAQKIPYPFEAFGAAVGLGLGCFMVALSHFFGSEKTKKKVFFVLAAFIFFTITFTPLLFAQDAGTYHKLNEVLENQKKILSDLDEIKKELTIVKVRATNK